MKWRATRHWLIGMALMGVSGITSGCTPGPMGNQPTLRTNTSAPTASDVSEVVKSTYDTGHQTVNLYVRGKASDKSPAGTDTTENLLDIHRPDGAINFALARYPNQNVREVNIYTNPNGRPSISIPVSSVISIANSAGPSTAVDGAGALAAGTVEGIPLPPPGVHMDAGIRPAAGLYDSIAKKTQAVINVARSKLGTKYIWGHNEDRGQEGFDCSNFTAYVYHHALGYKITTLSKGQYLYVGKRVPTSDMRPGDLLIFNKGGHVGIYVGGQRMIEEGGGLGKVGYLSVAPGTYWGNHLSVVKRMF